MQWVLMVNRTKLPFITSDNPVCITTPRIFQRPKVKSNKDDIKWVLQLRGSAEWELADGEPNPQIIIVFPLSSELMLLAAQTRTDDEEIVDDSLNEESVKSFNNMAVFQAREFLFSSSKDFSHIETLNPSNELTKIIDNVMNRLIQNNTEI